MRLHDWSCWTTLNVDYYGFRDGVTVGSRLTPGSHEAGWCETTNQKNAECLRRHLSDARATSVRRIFPDPERQNPTGTINSEQWTNGHISAIGRHRDGTGRSQDRFGQRRTYGQVHGPASPVQQTFQHWRVWGRTAPYL